MYRESVQLADNPNTAPPIQVCHPQLKHYCLCHIRPNSGIHFHFHPFIFLPFILPQNNSFPFILLHLFLILPKKDFYLFLFVLPHISCMQVNTPLMAKACSSHCSYISTEFFFLISINVKGHHCYIFLVKIIFFQYNIIYFTSLILISSYLMIKNSNKLH